MYFVCVSHDASRDSGTSHEARCTLCVCHMTRPVTQVRVTRLGVLQHDGVQRSRRTLLRQTRPGSVRRFKGVTRGRRSVVESYSDSPTEGGGLMGGG